VVEVATFGAAITWAAEELFAGDQNVRPGVPRVAFATTLTAPVVVPVNVIGTELVPFVPVVTIVVVAVEPRNVAPVSTRRTGVPERPLFIPDALTEIVATASGTPPVNVTLIVGFAVMPAASFMRVRRSLIAAVVPGSPVGRADPQATLL
jgi:hypothetical protein